MAGILDGYQFDPQAYGGGGGLLAQLAQQYGIPFPAQAPQGFAAPKGDYLGSAAGYAPTDYAPQGPPAPPLGTPIDVPSLQVAGAPNAQIPAGAYAQAVPDAGGLTQQTAPQNPLAGLLGSIGGGLSNLFSGGVSPAYAQAGPAPGAGQQPGIPAQAAAGPAGPGFLGRLQAGTTNLSTGGNLFSGLANAISGFSTGERTDQQGIALQAQAATYQALLQAGLDPGRAKAMALNPEVFKAVAPEIFSGYKIVQTGEGPFGDKQFMMQGPGGQLKPLSAFTGGAGGEAQQSGVPGASSSFLAPGVRQIDSNLAGQDYLKQFSPEVQAAVKDYVEGRSMPTGNPRKGFTQAVKMIAQKYGNDIGMPADDIAFAQRKKVATDFASGGNSAKNVKSLETIGGHLDKMMTIFDQLGNTWQPEYNTVGNWISQKLGSGKVNAYETVANGVANELGTVFRSSGMSDAEVKSWRDRISASNSPEQFQASMRTLLDMLKTRKEALQEQYSNPVTGLGRPLPKESFQNLDAAISKIEGKFAPGQAAPQQGTASQQSSAVALPKITTQAEYSKLSKGTQYIAPDGNVRTKR